MFRIVKSILESRKSSRKTLTYRSWNRTYVNVIYDYKIRIYHVFKIYWITYFNFINEKYYHESLVHKTIAEVRVEIAHSKQMAS